MGEVVAGIAYWLVVNVGVPVAVVNAAIVIGFNVALSAVSSALFGPKSPKADMGPAGIQVMKRSALEYRKIVYGQAAVSGPLYYNNLSGDDNEYLWHGIALADGASEDIVGVYFDKEWIPKADIDWAAGTGGADGTGTGDVSTARWVGDNSTNAAQIYYYLGDDAQPVPGSLNTAFSSAVTTNHRLRGITHIVTKFLYDPDTEEVWKGGPPHNIRVVLKGRRVYDPRLDTTQIIAPPSTYGSGAHRTATASTWAYSDNPALCVADYLMNVMGVAATSIDWPSVADAADDCDVLVVTTPAASPENTEKRFTCNGALSLGSTHKDNLDALLSSMDGRLAYSGGVWKVRASVWEASSVSITADDLAGDVEVRGSAPKSERFNAIRGYFIDPNREYEAAEFPHISSATYLTRDNGKVIEYDLQLPMTNSETMAQRIAMRMLEHGNDQTICKLKMNATGAKCAAGDVVDVTLDSLSWSAKTFRVIEWDRAADGTHDVVLKEDDSSTYTDPAVGDYGTGNTGGVTIPADTVPVPSSLTATSVPAGIRLDWTNPAAKEFDFIDVYASTSSAWGSASRIASVRANSFTHALTGGQVRYYWIRATRPPTSESLRDPNSDTSSITATAGSSAGPSGSASVFVNQYIRSSGTPGTPGASSASYNFDTATFTPTSSWSVGVPAQTSPITPVWVSTAQFYSSDSTGTDSSTTWSAPQKLAEDGADGADGDTGAAGAATAFVNQYIRNASPPGTPGTTSASYNFDTATFTPTSSWSAGVPAQTSPITPVWASTAQFYSADGTGTDSSTTWTAPQKLAEDGADGADGAAGATGAAGLNVATVYIYQRTATDSTPTLPTTSSATYTFADGTLDALNNGWTRTIPAKGTNEDYLWVSFATASANTATDEILAAEWEAAQKMSEAGFNSATVSLYHKNTSSSTPPSAFSGTFTYTFSTAALSGGTLNGWSQDAPDISAGEYLWVRHASAVSSEATDSVPTANFSTAVVVGIGGSDGTNGTSPVVSQLTNPAVVVSADYDGTGYSLTSAGGTHEVWEGSTEVTTSATHSVSGTATKSGLTISVVSGTGVYSLSGASWTSDEETFTLRAAYDGNNYDKQYSIAKSKQAQVPRINAIGVNKSSSQTSPTDAAVGYKVDSDGDVYSYADTGAKTYVSNGTWLNDGVNTEFDVMFEATGDTGALGGSAINTWLATTSDRAWTIEVTGLGDFTVTGTVYWRDDTTLEVLGSASLTLQATVEI